MKQSTESYLLTVASNLQLLPEAERNDILEEISSHIDESLKSGLSEEEVLNNLGDPDLLAKSFLGGNLMKSKTFNMKQIFALITFYAKTGFSGMIIVPFLSILSMALYICVFLVLAAGTIITVGSLLGFDFPPLVLNMGFWSAPNVLALPITVPFAFFFYLLSNYLWNNLKKYLSAVSKNYNKINNKPL